MNKKDEFISLLCSAFKREIIKKLIFSRPATGEVKKISGRLCAHRGRRILALEYSLPGDTVSHKNLPESEMTGVVRELLQNYRQANLITTAGDAEWKISSSGKEALLGADRLMQKMRGDAPAFERAIDSLDNKRNHLLKGDEDFLIALGVSDKTGRVHDKRQGKFRQINRFLEHIEAVYKHLPPGGEILIYDLCCGKSYLSFAVYYYLTEVKGRDVRLFGIDLKRDVITWCSSLAKELGYSGMTFICDDVTNTPTDRTPDMVISLHACDIATDIVIDRAAELGAKVILSTPCCHKYLNERVMASELSFVTMHPQLRNKLCEALTDGIRLARLETEGYEVSALELTDPDDTPKNTLLRAVKKKFVDEKILCQKRASYDQILSFLLGDTKEDYLKEIKKV